MRASTTLLHHMPNRFDADLAAALQRRNVKLFNSLLSRHARFGEVERVQKAFDALCALRPPLKPNEYTYGILLNAYVRLADYSAGERCRQILSEMQGSGVPVSAVVYTTVIKGRVNALDMPSGEPSERRPSERSCPPLPANMRI